MMPTRRSASSARCSGLTCAYTPCDYRGQERRSPRAFDTLQQDSTLPEAYLLRQCTYLNNVVEQGHRFVKRLVNPGLGFGAFHTAQQTIHGYEAMHMFRKGQIEGIAKRDVLAKNRVINQRFGLAA